jgi:hypothetical protein
MGNGRASAAALTAKAKANCYQKGAHKEQDRKRQPKTHVETAKGNHDAALSRYLL